MVAPGTTAEVIGDALSKKARKALPWATVRAAIDGACQNRLLERTAESGLWPCGYPAAGKVVLRPRSETPPPPPLLDVLVASAVLQPAEIQDLADQIGEISNAAVGYDLKIGVRIEVETGGNRPPQEIIARINAKLGKVTKDFQLG